MCQVGDILREKGVMVSRDATSLRLANLSGKALLVFKLENDPGPVPKGERIKHVPGLYRKDVLLRYANGMNIQ